MLAYSMRGLLALVFSILIAAPLTVSATTEPLPDDYGTGEGRGIYCPALRSTFQRGATDASTGGQVSELQRFLVSYYDDAPESLVVGVYGPTTFRYVTRFQRENGLPPLGIVGSLTRAAIKQACGSTAPTPPLSCPVYSPPLCEGGVLVSQGYDSNGCQKPPRCERAACSAIGWVKPTVGCNGTWTATYSDVGCQNGWKCIPEVGIQKCGVNTFGLENQCSQQFGSTYRSAYVQCYDGYSKTIYSANDSVSNSCSTSEALRREAEYVCANRCAGVVPPSTDVLNVTPSSGATPLTVKAIFPVEWQSLVNSACASTQPAYGGRTFSVDWGDGTFPSHNGRNSPCLYHTYSSAGTYSVKGKVYDFSDVNEFNGSFTRDVWTGVGQVTVTHSDVSGNPAIEVSSPGAGLTVAQGQVLRVAWASKNMPANAAVALWLVKSGGGSVGAIALKQQATGIYEWTVPGAACVDGICRSVMDSPMVHYVDAGSYRVVAEMYTPADACFGYCAWSGAKTTLVKAEGGIFQITGAEGTSAGSAISCVLTANKESYGYGETITFTWRSTNATYAYFVAESLGKDNLQVPGDKLAANGTQTILANVLGNPYVTLKVGNANNQYATCTKAVRVSSEQGDTTVSSAAPSKEFQLASALTALEVALGAIKALLGR